MPPQEFTTKLKEVHYYDVVNPQGYTIGKFEKGYATKWVFKSNGDRYLTTSDLEGVLEKLKELNADETGV